MRRLSISISATALLVLLFIGEAAFAQAERFNSGPSPTLQKMREELDQVRAIDTHDHLRPFDQLQTSARTEHGPGMNLQAVWRSSYYPWYNPLAPWKDGEPFSAWWDRARNNFEDARATTFYRYMLPAFRDLYGVNFDKISDAEAAQLDSRIFQNYKDPGWIDYVVRQKAKIDIVLNDPYWSRLDSKPAYPFEVRALNVTRLVDGFHPAEFSDPLDNPYLFAEKEGIPVQSLSDYVGLLDHLVKHCKDQGAVCLKSTLAYSRTIEFENVPADRAANAFGRLRSELIAEEVKAFQDFIQWRLVELAAKHDLPLQIHTGHARIQGSNPMLLVDMIEANPRTRFILFHGGYPWVGESGAIVTRHASHVWLDSVWLPTISFTMAKRAFHEWLEVMPSNRILWGADSTHAEGVYGATVMTRRCISEVLAEKVDAGDLSFHDALRIGRQILRDNALSLFPAFQNKLQTLPSIDPPPAR